jgi:hypothetical protein
VKNGDRYWWHRGCLALIVAYIAEGATMLEPTKVESDAKNVSPAGGRAVEVQDSTMWIRNLSIDRTGVVAYLQSIPPEKQEIALIHALEVGVIELIARRGRFRH